MFVWDYIVVFAVLIISVAIGIFYRLTGGKQQTIHEYLLANRSLSVWPVSFSTLATCMSAVSITGLSSENYKYGMQFIAINIGYAIFTPVIAYLFLPVFFQLKTTSVFEFLEKRFGNYSKSVACLSSVFQMIFYSGLVLYAPSLSLEGIFLFSRTQIIIFLGLVCVFYSLVGGIKAVVISDLFQAIIMYLSILSVIVYTSIKLESFKKILEIASEGGRTNILNFDIDPKTRYTVWNSAIGGGFIFMASYAVGPSYVQKYLSMKNVAEAKKAVWLNLPILIIFNLLTSLSGIAIYANYRNCDPVLNQEIDKYDKEYLLGNKEISSWSISFSLMATTTSTITLLGYSSETYAFGTQYSLINFGYIIFTPLISYLFIPVFYENQISNSYQYLDMRFGNSSKCLASLFGVFQYMLYLGVVLYGPAVALEFILHIDKTLIIVIIGMICTIYSILGGLKAVVLTDVFQSVLMYTALLAILGHSIMTLGGISSVLHIASREKRLSFFNTSVDFDERYTVWSSVFGGGFIFLSIYAISPSFVQKYLSTKDLKSAQNAVWLNLPILMLTNILCCLSGVAMFSFFADCDPVSNHQIRKYDEIMPFYVLENFTQHPGLTGLFVAGIFSASLSTLSSVINSLAAVLLEDYVKPIYLWSFKRNLTPKKTLMVTKSLVLLLGTLSMFLAFWADKFQSILQLAFTIFSLIGGPMLGIFSLGMFTITANDQGSCLGFLFGIVGSVIVNQFTEKGLETLPFRTDGCVDNRLGSRNSTLSIESAQNKRRSMDSFEISYLWLCPIAWLITFTTGLIFSKIISCLSSNNKVQKPIDLKLLSPPVAAYFKNNENAIKNDVELDAM